MNGHLANKQGISQTYTTPCACILWYIKSTMSITKKKPRVYRRITPQTVAQHKAAVILHGNGSAAVRAAEPTRLSPKDRSFRIKKKGESIQTTEFIDDQLQRIGVDAVNRLGRLVNSTDERIAIKSIMYSIDHIRGQATKKSIALTGKLNIQNVLD